MDQRLKFFIPIIVLMLIVLAVASRINMQRVGDRQVQVFEDGGGPQEKNEITHPLQITEMRKIEYPGSEITIEQELSDGGNYKKYIASYKSEGLKIFALLTIPKSDPSVSPQDDNRKYPVIVFNHGYIPLEQYQTTERYTAYVDVFARKGYIVFKPDYRGHGNSEGRPEGAYFSPAYTIDVLNAVSSVKKLKDPSTGSGRVADQNRIGMWGHSMGGHITLRSMVITKDIKVGVIWAGVVASYEDMMNRWRRSIPWRPSGRENMARRPTRDELIKQFGDFTENPTFWQSISPIFFVKDISGPIQLHHGTSDTSVPLEFSEKLNSALKEKGREVEFYTYSGDDHNLSNNLSSALQRSVEFFDKYLKD